MGEYEVLERTARGKDGLGNVSKAGACRPWTETQNWPGTRTRTGQLPEGLMEPLWHQTTACLDSL